MTFHSLYRPLLLTFTLLPVFSCVSAQFVTSEEIQTTEVAKNARYVILGAGAFEPNNIPLVQEITNGSLTGKPIQTIMIQAGAAEAYLLNTLREETAFTKGVVRDNIFTSLESEFYSCLSERLSDDTRFIGYEYERDVKYTLAALEMMLTKSDHPGAASCLSYIHDRTGHFSSQFSIFTTRQEMCDSLFKRLFTEDMLDSATTGELHKVHLSYLQRSKHQEVYQLLPTWPERLAVFQRDLYFNLERIITEQEQPEEPLLILCYRLQVNKTYTKQRKVYDSFTNLFMQNPDFAPYTLCLGVVYDEGWESKTRRKLGMTGKNKRMLMYAGSRLWRKNTVLATSNAHYYTFDRHTRRLFETLQKEEAFPGCK